MFNWTDAQFTMTHCPSKTPPLKWKPVQNAACARRWLPLKKSLEASESMSNKSLGAYWINVKKVDETCVQSTCPSLRNSWHPSHAQKQLSLKNQCTIIVFQAVCAQNKWTMRIATYVSTFSGQDWRRNCERARSNGAAAHSSKMRAL